MMSTNNTLDVFFIGYLHFLFLIHVLLHWFVLGENGNKGILILVLL